MKHVNVTLAQRDMSMLAPLIGGRWAWCSCPFDENRRRYAERERHPGHYDAALLPELDEVLRTAEPLGLGEVLRVETDRDLDAVSLARSVLAAARLEPEG